MRLQTPVQVCERASLPRAGTWADGHVLNPEATHWGRGLRASSSAVLPLLGLFQLF